MLNKHAFPSFLQGIGSLAVVLPFSNVLFDSLPPRRSYPQNQIADYWQHVGKYLDTAMHRLSEEEPALQSQYELFLDDHDHST